MKLKFGISISFNESEKQKMKIENFYDVFLNVLKNKQLNLKAGFLLTIEEWIKEEGRFAKEELEGLKEDLKYEVIEYKRFGGNRYEVEYYKGILILMDDLYWAKSNVVSI